MGIISACGLISLAIAITEGVKITGKKSDDSSRLIFILFWGSMATITGILGQMVGLMQAFSVIERVGDISLSIIMGGLKVSMYPVVYGVAILIISSLLWLILKWISSRNKA